MQITLLAGAWVILVPSINEYMLVAVRLFGVSSPGGVAVQEIRPDAGPGHREAHRAVLAAVRGSAGRRDRPAEIHALIAGSFANTGSGGPPSHAGERAVSIKFIENFSPA